MQISCINILEHTSENLKSKDSPYTIDIYKLERKRYLRKDRSLVRFTVSDKKHCMAIREIGGLSKS